jgi:hypothetical protein
VHLLGPALGVSDANVPHTALSIEHMLPTKSPQFSVKKIAGVDVASPCAVLTPWAGTPLEYLHYNPFAVSPKAFAAGAASPSRAAPQLGCGAAVATVTIPSTLCMFHHCGVHKTVPRRARAIRIQFCSLGSAADPSLLPTQASGGMHLCDKQNGDPEVEAASKPPADTAGSHVGFPPSSAVPGAPESVSSATKAKERAQVARGMAEGASFVDDASLIWPVFPSLFPCAMLSCGNEVVAWTVFPVTGSGRGSNAARCRSTKGERPHCMSQHRDSSSLVMTRLPAAREPGRGRRPWERSSLGCSYQTPTPGGQQ